MTANPHLAAQLDDFARLESPGFAFMITAPWGAGKTHAVRKWLGDRNRLYVSLFGIDSLAGVEEALFEAAFVSRQGAKLAMNPTRAVSGLAKGLEGLLEKTTGVSFDASGLVRKAVLADAPRLLVLDDLERAQLDPPRLLSIINRFVEHEGKTVLLLANEDEFERAKGQPAPDAPKSDYRRWREKVVGRTITLRPDTEAALDSFLDAITDEGARTALANRREAILDVFARSQTDNLRLLRQSLIECGRFLTWVPEVYRGQDRTFTSLIADYLALSIDWLAGDRLTALDFDLYALESQRQERRSNSNAPMPGLDKLRARHDDSPYTDLANRYFPLGLAYQAIVDGHASDKDIGQLMREAGGFSHELEEDAVQTLSWWYEREERSVEAAFHDLQTRISELALVEPSLILRAWGSLLSLSRERLFGLMPEKVVTDALAYVDQLSVGGLLLTPGDADDMERWSTGSSRESAEYARIREYLRMAVISSQERHAPGRLRTLLDDLKSDPDRFFVAIRKEGDLAKGIPDLSKQQVFLAAEAPEVAQEVLALAPDRLRRFLSPMERRQRDLNSYATQEGGPPNRERQWLLDFRKRAWELAEASSPIRRAQILMVVNDCLAFLDTPSEPPNS